MSRDTIYPLSSLGQQGILIKRVQVDAAGVESVSLAAMHPIHEGEPLPRQANIPGAELVSLARQEDGGYSVSSHALVSELLGQTPAATPARKGPAQIATDQYRESYERTFKKPIQYRN